MRTRGRRVVDSSHGTSARDALEALLGGWSPERAETARGLAHAARLLDADLMGARSPSSAVMRGVEPEPARALDGASGLEEVALHLARRARPRTAHGALPSPAHVSPRAVPDEKAQRALGLLIASARRGAEDTGPLAEQRWHLWTARLARWSGAWSAARRALDELEAGAARRTDPPGVWLAAAAFEERLALALDRGDRRSARELLAERPEHDGPTGALLRWAAGDDEAAHRIGDADPGDWAGRALRGEPKAPLLVELDLDGAAAAEGLERARVGARAVVLAALEERGGRIISADVAPGLAEALQPWSARARDAHLDVSGPLRRARPGAQAAVLVRGAMRPRDGIAIEASCLGGAASAARAILCVPLPGAGGIGGWLWVEFDHRLLPPPCQIASLAVAAEAALARQRGRDARAWGSSIESALGKLARRRWALLTPSGAPRGAPASSGGAGALGGLRDREAWPASRALREGTPVRYGPVLRSRAHRQPSDRGADTLFERSSSGAAIPLRVGAVPVAAVVVESTRRGDARPENVERWERGLGRAAHEVFAAALDEQLRRRGGFGVDVEAPDGRAFVEWLARAGVASGAQVFEIAGPPGAGRMTAAAALHEARVWFGARGPLTLVAPHPCMSALGRAIGRATRPGATVVVSELEGRSTLERGVAERWRSGAAKQNTALVLITRPRGEAEEEGSPRANARWDLPALEGRRHWIPSVARAMTRAIEGRHVTPPLPEAALAALWRQRWGRGVRGLAGLLRSAAAAGPITAQSLGAAARELDLEWRERIPPREATVRDLAAAAWTARTSRGRRNAAGAARLMGWDPSTFAARARAAGLQGIEAARRTLA